MVVKAEQTIDMDAAVGRVWEFVTAVRLWPLWLRGVDAVRADGRPVPGMRFMIQRAGQPLPDRWIVADWAPPGQVRFTDYGRDIQLSLVLVERGPARTQLRVALEWPRPRGPLGGLLAKATPGGRLAHGLDASLGALAQIFAADRDRALLHARDGKEQRAT